MFEIIDGLTFDRHLPDRVQTHPSLPQGRGYYSVRGFVLVGCVSSKPLWTASS